MVRRYVGCADAVVAAYSRIDVPVASDLRSSTVRTYNESMYAVDKLWHATVCASGAAEQAAGARAWLDAYLEHSLFRRLEAMLQQLHNNAALVVSAVAPLTPRYGGPCLRPYSVLTVTCNPVPNMRIAVYPGNAVWDAGVTS